VQGIRDKTVFIKTETEGIYALCMMRKQCVKGQPGLGRGHNEKELKKDPTAHAEISAIKDACQKLGTWRLNDCDMYVTLEPCPMCAGAIIQSRIGRLFIGALDSKSGAAGSVVDLFRVSEFNHRVEVTYGILSEECSGILKDFFKKLRKS
jgi:tRNA(adenine34) deaminase